MENIEEIEQTIWEYIDGTCKDADRHTIAVNIVENKLWKTKYEELRALHLDINNVIELEHPSLRFNKNVMDAILSTTIAPATSKYINKNIISFIGGFFIIVILVSLAIVISQSHPAATPWQLQFAKVTSDLLKNFKYLNSGFVYLVIGINSVLVWALIDKIIKRNNIITER